MLTRFLIPIAVALSVLVLPVVQADHDLPVELRLATTEWCPYTCVEQGVTDNIIGVYLTRLLAQHNVKLRIETYPWSRSIQLAERGQVDGLLTAVESEAPSLLFTSVPTSTYQVCFFTQSSDWRFTGVMDLGDQRLGVIQGYGYSPVIDQYVAEHADSRQIEQVGGRLGTFRLLQMLDVGRIDVLVEDSLVLAREAQKNRFDISNVKQIGCEDAQPFFIALHPSIPNVQYLIEVLNTALASDTNRQMLRTIQTTLID